MATPSDTRQPIAELMGALRRYAAEVGADPAILDDVGYRHGLNAALDGRIPAVRVNSRWFWENADLPVIAAAFGVQAKAAVPPRSRRRTTTSAVAL